MPRRWSALPTVVGIAVGGAALVFVVVAMTSAWSEVHDQITRASTGWLVAGLAAAAVAMVWIAGCWSRAFALVAPESQPERRRVLAWYFAGEIGKYVPGGIWTVVGRGELARRSGVAGSLAYASVGLSLAGFYLAGLTVTAMLLPLAALSGAQPAAALGLLALLPFGLVLLHPRVLGRGRAVLVRFTGRGHDIALPSWGATIGLVVRYVPAWLLICMATWCVARALLPHPPVLRLGVAAMLSWWAGLAAVPVPAGAGVREATFVALAGLPVGVAATIAVASRLMFVTVDVLGALCAAPWAVPAATRAQSDAATP